jgi:hypothetical protein
VNQSAGACSLPAVPRDALDTIVLDALSERIFEKDHLRELLGHLLDRSANTDKRRRKDLALARGQLTAPSKAITNLLLTIESGAMRPNDQSFIERMAHNRARKSVLEADIRNLECQLASSQKQISEEMIAAFGEKMRHALRPGDPAFRSAYVRLFVSRVELSTEEIRIFGFKSAIERTLTASASSKTGAVPIFDREWCQKRTPNLLVNCCSCVL